MPPIDRDTALAAALCDLGAGWLSVRCGRCGVTHLPVRMLRDRYGADLRLGAVVVRLRCGTCRRRPVAVALVDDPAAGTVGGPAASWSVPLRP